MSYLTGVSVCYIIFYFLTPKFLGWLNFPSAVKPKFKSRLLSIIIFLLFSSLIFYLSLVIPDRIIANRLLHSIGGGFVAILIIFLSVKDNKIIIGKLPFFIISALIVTALGVGNEIVEFCLQNFFGFFAADTINDTWLDLISNSTGILLALAIFTPQISVKK